MTDLDTKELKTPKDAPPDATEGEPMLTLELLNTQLMILRVEVDALKQRFETLMTPQQITEMFTRVETLMNSVMQRFSEIEFSAAKVDAISTALQTLLRADVERRQSHEFVQRALSSLLGYDISNPAAPRIGLSIFETINQTNETADSAIKRVDAIVEEITQVRLDSVKMLTAAEKIEAYHTKHEAAFAAIAQNAQRWKSVQEAVKTVASNPKLLIPTVAAFGSGLVVAPEALKVIASLIVSLFTGAN